MFEVRQVDYDEWKIHLNNCQQINMLQCWQYGAAKEHVQNWRAVRFLVMNGNGDVVALAQFLVKEFGILGGVARMNRGPLLTNINNDATRPDITYEAIQVLLAESRKRRWWLVQIAPEIKQAEDAVKRLKKLGLRQSAAAPSASAYFHLTHLKNNCWPD